MKYIFSSADLSVITYVTYDLHQSYITQVIRDAIAEGTKVRGPITLLHSKVISNADILVYYLSQSVQKQAQHKAAVETAARINCTSDTFGTYVWRSARRETLLGFFFSYY